VEFVGPYDDEKLGFNRLLRFVLPRLVGGGARLEFFINTKACWARFRPSSCGQRRAARDAASRTMPSTRCPEAGQRQDQERLLGVIPLDAGSRRRWKCCTRESRHKKIHTICVRSSVTSYCGRVSQVGFNYMAPVKI
jgi:hypothetical protein